MHGPDFNVARSQHSIALYNRQIVVCSGAGELSSCESLPLDSNDDPAVSAWQPFPSLPVGVYDGCMLVIDGKVRLRV